MTVSNCLRGFFNLTADAEFDCLSQDDALLDAQARYAAAAEWMSEGNRLRRFAAQLLALARKQRLADLSTDDLIEARRRCDAYRRSVHGRRVREEQYLDCIIESLFRLDRTRWSDLDLLKHPRRVGVVAEAMLESPLPLAFVNAAGCAKATRRQSIARMALEMRDLEYYLADRECLIAFFETAAARLSKRTRSFSTLRDGLTQGRYLVRWAFRLGMRPDEPFAARRSPRRRPASAETSQTKIVRLTKGGLEFNALADRNPFLYGLVNQVHGARAQGPLRRHLTETAKDLPSDWSETTELHARAMEERQSQRWLAGSIPWYEYRKIMTAAKVAFKHAREKGIIPADPMFLLRIGSEAKRASFILYDPVTPWRNSIYDLDAARLAKRKRASNAVRPCREWNRQADSWTLSADSNDG